jgi:hypothetical protein
MRALMSPPRRKMSGDKHLAVVRHEAQLFDAAHTGLSRMGETPIREIQKAALKDSQADDRQGIDCHEKGQRPFQPIFPLSPKSSLAGWLDGLSASGPWIVALVFISELPKPAQ